MHPTEIRRVLRLAAGVLAASVGLSSCSAISQRLDTLGAAMRNVEEPAATAPHALMRISTDGYTWVHPGQACESATNPRGGIAVSANSVYIGARNLKDQVRGVSGEAPKGLASGEIRVSVGEPQVLAYTVSWRRGDWQYSCHAARSFVPVEGAHYQMVTLSDAATRTCSLAVMQLLPTPVVVETTEAPQCAAS